MKIIINRIRIKERSTDGMLYIDGQHVCDTTEATPTLLPAGTYAITVFKCIKSKRQIPLIRLDGSQYYNGRPIPPKCARCAALASECERLRLSVCDKLRYAIENDLPYPEVVSLEQVLEKEARQDRQTAISHAGDAANCPKLLYGNGVFNRTDGSILVGIYRQPGVVTNSRPIFDRLYDRIEKTLSRGHTVKLVIYDSATEDGR